MFIVFEGIDGSGKTTLSKKLAEFLLSKGIKAVWTREPYSETIRELLKTKELSPWGETYLFLADRDLHLRELVKPFLEKGFAVVSDRFYLSTLAYQGFGRGLDLGRLREMNDFVTGGFKPDLTFVLDLEPEEALKRIKKSGRKTDRFEDSEFLRRVREGFLKLAEEEGAVVLDASKSFFELFGEVLEVIDRLFRRRDLK
jgi:dTMP kinase